MTMIVPIRHLRNLYDCNADYLTDAEPLEEKIKFVLGDLYNPESSRASQFYHQERPEEKDGVTGIYFFESHGLPNHLTIHTWPQEGRAAIDRLQYDSSTDLLRRFMEEFQGSYINPKLIPEMMNFGREVFSHLEDPHHFEKLNSPQRAIRLLNDVAVDARFSSRESVYSESYSYLSAGSVLTESHFILHHFKRENHAIVDIFTCGDEGDPTSGVTELVRHLNPKNTCYTNPLLR